jgi:hypothetical protein
MAVLLLLLLLMLILQLESKKTFCQCGVRLYDASKAGYRAVIK